jgi:hypothetical protein
MAVIRYAGFSGENRAINPVLLPETVGVASRNQKPGRGDLRPWKSPLTVAASTAGRQTIYRMGRDIDNDAQYWLSWTTAVNVVRGFDANDTTEQTFYTGDGIPKFTDNILGLATAPYPTTSRPMGIPAPVGAPTVAGTNSGATSPVIEYYYYVYTYVSTAGWESAPSPVSALVTRDNLGSTSISGFSSVPSGNYDINRIRIYRTQGSSTGTDFYFLGEISIATSSTTDNNQTLGEVLSTNFWFPAPGIPTGGATSITEPTLSNLTAMWNGMMSGISGNSVRICEPYTPYAWPPTYEIIPPDSKPVGLGVFGQTLLVLTTGRPLVAQGSTPDGMDQKPLEINQACVAARSIVSMGTGVAWASEDGLCWLGQDGARVITSGVMLREDWQALVPSSIIGKMYEGMYLGSYNDGSGRKGFIIDPSGGGIYFLDVGYEAMYFDSLKDQLYVLNGANIGKWDAGTALTYRSRSKPFRQGVPINFAAAVVVANAYPVTFRLYADGALKHTQTVADRNPFRLPSGYRAFEFQIELEGSNPVQDAAIATSIEELKQL